MKFYDLHSKSKSSDINLIFPNWIPNNERVVIISPHDDDVILGAGYILLASLIKKAEVYIVIINDGSAGYSRPELKDTIIQIRRGETVAALKILGLSEKNIIRYDIPDFSSIHYLGWKFPWANEDGRKQRGLFTKMLNDLRRINATRLILPNEYREHIDHTAAFISAIYNGPQAGDPVVIDYGKPFKIESYLQYSVWGKFNPNNALINKRKTTIRANRAIIVEKEFETKIERSLKEFKSQEDIIDYILEVRKQRKLSNKNKFIELYLDIDPRPRFDYKPYIDLIGEIDKVD
ncbi:MAG: PIG-L deacetylase family protein [Promethearchaeota archaeon]